MRLRQTYVALVDADGKAAARSGFVRHCGFGDGLSGEICRLALGDGGRNIFESRAAGAAGNLDGVGGWRAELWELWVT